MLITMTKKEKISHALKVEVWNTYIGAEKGIGMCHCCQKKIDSKHFECGHIISEKNNGIANLNNLRPVCDLCNKSMGTKNMNDFRDNLLNSSGKWYEKNIDMGLKLPNRTNKDINNTNNNTNVNVKWYEREFIV